jgi:AbrB family looped-hinge helix DNA binding protein
MEMAIKDIDEQGRIVIPKALRKKYKIREKVIIRSGEGKLELIPLEEKELAKYFDSATADIKADLSHWHKVRTYLIRNYSRY